MMSHFTKVKTKIADFEALKNALASMGLRLENNADCRYYYGRKRKEYVVKLPGSYDLSFDRETDATYSLTADYYDGEVEKTIGPRGSILMKHYAVEKLKIETRKKGYSIREFGENRYKIYDPKDTSNSYLEATIDEEGNVSFKSKGFSGECCMKFNTLEKAFGEATTQKTSEFYTKESEKIVQRERC